jgi:Na+/melibiose symporter-like transporter
VIGQVIVLAGARTLSVPLVMTGWAIGFFASGAAMAIPFSILSDAIDYGEWRCGVRAAGLLTAVGAAFCLKAGSGLGGALPAWILSWSGYVPNVAQSARSLKGIELSCVWLPAAAYALAALPVFFYYRYERMEPQVRGELAARRQAAALISEAV